jgi:hypothetical protein
MMGDLRSCVSGDPEFVMRWIEIVDKSEREEKLWIEELRKNGFKAAHPNDGWVDRENNIITFAYPQFFDNADVGDLVMLGWPSDTDRLRPIRLTRKINNNFFTDTKSFYFKDMEKIGDSL